MHSIHTMYWFHNRGHFVGFDVISLLLWCTSSKIICILCVFWTRDLDCCSCWDWYRETVLFSHLECLSSECFTLCLLPLYMYYFLWPKNMKKWRLGKNADFFFILENCLPCCYLDSWFGIQYQVTIFESVCSFFCDRDDQLDVAMEIFRCLPQKTQQWVYIMLKSFLIFSLCCLYNLILPSLLALCAVTPSRE